MLVCDVNPSMVDKSEHFFNSHYALLILLLQYQATDSQFGVEKFVKKIFAHSILSLSQHLSPFHLQDYPDNVLTH